MTDFIGEIKRNIAGVFLSIFNIACNETNVSCPANEFAARTALPLIHNADACAWQSVINDNKQAFTLWGIMYMDSVDLNGGHMLFNFSACFYKTLVERMLNELPPVSLEWSAACAESKKYEHAIYAKHRMRMLARKSGQDTGNCGKTLCDDECYTYKSVQKAILLIAALVEPGIGMRALELRLHETSSALLIMTHCVVPRERAKLSKDCSLIAKAALRALQLALDGVNNL